jgi:hypothetical protein
MARTRPLRSSTPSRWRGREGSERKVEGESCAEARAEAERAQVFRPPVDASHASQDRHIRDIVRHVTVTLVPACEHTRSVTAKGIMPPARRHVSRLSVAVPLDRPAASVLPARLPPARRLSSLPAATRDAPRSASAIDPAAIAAHTAHRPATQAGIHVTARSDADGTVSAPATPHAEEEEKVAIYPNPACTSAAAVVKFTRARPRSSDGCSQGPAAAEYTESCSPCSFRQSEVATDVKFSHASRSQSVSRRQRARRIRRAQARRHRSACEPRRRRPLERRRTDTHNIT